MRLRIQGPAKLVDQQGQTISDEEYLNEANGLMDTQNLIEVTSLPNHLLQKFALLETYITIGKEDDTLIAYADVYWKDAELSSEIEEVLLKAFTRSWQARTSPFKQIECFIFNEAFFIEIDSTQLSINI